MNKLSGFLVLAIAASSFLFLSSQRGIERRSSGRDLSNPMLRPGDSIDDMVITTGIKHAAPLWNFCSSKKENNHTIRVDCSELSDADIAIGYPFGVMDLARQCIDWKAFRWEMSLDGHPLDLEAFGVDDIVSPGLASSSSPVREAFQWIRLWNVVLENPTPGMHQLQGQARSLDGVTTYTWAVNFTVATPWPALPQSWRHLSLYR